MTDEAKREEQANALAGEALAVAPSLLAHTASILGSLAALLDGRKTIAVQTVERPHEERENPGLAQWDHYVRVFDADDEPEFSKRADA